jgi:hypothetical protein
MMIAKHGFQLGALLLVVASQVACKEEQSSAKTTDAAVNANQAQTIDPKLREALAPASGSPSSRGPTDGPPARGVFEQGQADVRHRKGAPVMIQIGSEGAEPRILLGSGTAEVKGPARMSVSVHTGPRSALPSVDLTFSLKTDKPKDKLPDGGVGASTLIAKVDKVALSATQPGQMPAGADKEVAKLVGSLLTLKPSERGGTEDISLTVEKGVGPDLKYVLFGAADTLFAMSVPVPAKPMGAGGAWIVEARNNFSGIDTVSYRLYRIKSIDNGAVTLDVEVRQYASSTQDGIEGLPAGGLQQFDSTAKGHLKLNAGETFAIQGDFDQRRTMLLQDNQQRVLNVQLQTETKLTR